jgi:hypothetical protein
MRAGGAALREEKTGTTGIDLGPEVRAAQEQLKQAFDGQDDRALAQLLKLLESTLGARRDEWSTATTRALFDAALAVESCRLRSAEHEARWLQLTGFCLRPGLGAPLDSWRTRQMWRVFNENLAFEKSEANRLAWWILWRRIAGGLSKGQQEQIYDRLAQLFLPGVRQKKLLHKFKPSSQEVAEMWRTLANLERLPVAHKIKLGDELARRLESKKGRSEVIHYWALGRIGARVPLYGPLDAVVPPQRAEAWLAALLAQEWPEPEKIGFAAAQLGRRTGDRARDIDEEARRHLVHRLRSVAGMERTARLVEEVVALEAVEERVALGDTLPAGLRLIADDEAAAG